MPPMETRSARRVTNALPASWVGIEYLMVDRLMNGKWEFECKLTSGKAKTSERISRRPALCHLAPRRPAPRPAPAANARPPSPRRRSISVRVISRECGGSVRHVSHALYYAVRSVGRVEHDSDPTGHRAGSDATRRGGVRDDRPRYKVIAPLAAAGDELENRRVVAHVVLPAPAARRPPAPRPRIFSENRLSAAEGAARLRRCGERRRPEPDPRRERRHATCYWRRLSRPITPR
ncbi:hypothetical protein EVAR_79106_1 [Eumeta japonica]|uniref:Uncharacterized protein n=1 Tax=Eumeta variegata TaxID=151549 RepID=A0A4C1X1M1_EUMVA|nr:hypothetical protein EVAR_79106_1 [Eumeta japonica]